MGEARQGIFVPPVAVVRAGRDWSLRALVDILLEWHERARQRRQLLSLSDHMLKDIGISRADAEGEASKPFWQP